MDFFAQSTAIDAPFKVLNTATGEVMVDFTQADADNAQAFYTKQATLDLELSIKLEALSDACAKAGSKTGPAVTIEAGNANTVCGMFHVLTPAFKGVKSLMGQDALKAYSFAVPGLPTIGVSDMAQLMLSITETAQVIASLEAMAAEAQAATATKH